MEVPLLERDTERDSYRSGSDTDDTNDDLWLTTGRAARHRSKFTFMSRKISRLVIFLIAASVVLFSLTALSLLHGRQFLGIPSSWLFHKAEEKAVFDDQGNLLQHPHYIVFDRPKQRAHHSLADIPLRPVRRLPSQCLDAHFAQGEPCYDDGPSTFDIVWTWVNASDWRLQDEMRKALEHFNLPTSDEQAGESNSKLYRDHDELRHSLRSVLRHFRPYIRKFNIFTSDFPFSQDSYTNTQLPPQVNEIPNNSTIRLGQLPNWLQSQDKERWRDGDVPLKIVYQSQVFRNFSGLSFNSFGIETQLPHLRDIEYNLIYLNDDFYYTADLLPSDFYTSAYGTVLRFDINFPINPEKIADSPPAGEWGPLQYTSWLLSERFGYRSRPYAKHVAKSFPVTLLDEAARIWEKEFQETANHRFRGTRGPSGLWDVHTTFLLPHLLVERWREALLWSWVVGRVGGMNDEWSSAEKNQAWSELGGVSGTSKIDVYLSERKTLDESRVSATLSGSGEAVSQRTRYDFSSLDGYPYGFVNEDGETALPMLSGADVNVSRKVCELDFEECFGGSTSASDAFKTVTFDRVQCGDCIIHALRAKSGDLGLSAFLPSPDRKYTPNTLWSELLHFDTENDNIDKGNGVPDDEDNQQMSQEEQSSSSSPSSSSSFSSSQPNDQDLPSEEAEDEPHLPLDNNWRTAQFALKDVLDSYGSSDSVQVRHWIERVMERYRFIIGDTSVLFLMIEGPDQARTYLGSISEDVSLFCMNDDVKEGFWETDRILRDWQERRWSTAAQWERST